MDAIDYEVRQTCRISLVPGLLSQQNNPRLIEQEPPQLGSDRRRTALPNQAGTVCFAFRPF